MQYNKLVSFLLLSKFLLIDSFRYIFIVLFCYSHPATSSSAVLCAGEAEGEDNEAEEEGSLASSLMQEFWSAVSGTGVQVTTTLDAEL